MAGTRGALIVLEGVDRAGKTTQCSKLVQALQQSGRPAEMMRFPDRTTTIGQLIGAYLENKSDLEDHTVHLLFSANRWEMVPLMKKKLEQGITLVVDRYAFSGVAFTSANMCSPYFILGLVLFIVLEKRIQKVNSWIVFIFTKL
uniref:dTMP kinase n=1 Tax=Oreochromis aureus TaxID=47969 RepID=A0A668ULH2_OREAU